MLWQRQSDVRGGSGAGRHGGLGQPAAGRRAARVPGAGAPGAAPGPGVTALPRGEGARRPRVPELGCPGARPALTRALPAGADVPEQAGDPAVSTAGGAARAPPGSPSSPSVPTAVQLCRGEPARLREGAARCRSPAGSSPAGGASAGTGLRVPPVARGAGRAGDSLQGRPGGSSFPLQSRPSGGQQGRFLSLPRPLVSREQRDPRSGSAQLAGALGNGPSALHSPGLPLTPQSISCSCLFKCLQEVQCAAAKGGEGGRLLRTRSQEPDPDAARAAGTVPGRQDSFLLPGSGCVWAGPCLLAPVLCPQRDIHLPHSSSANKQLPCSRCTMEDPRDPCCTGRHRAGVVPLCVTHRGHWGSCLRVRGWRQPAASVCCHGTAQPCQPCPELLCVGRQTPSSTASATCSPPRRMGTTACPLKTSLIC